ncbi:MAG: RNA chaperone Hfq [Candidatus Sumerlaeia bacterium]
MASHNVNLQDSFLNQVRKDNIEVEVMLLTGGSFTGVVKGFDNFTVIMHVDETQHLVYKHAIAQMTAPKFARNTGDSGHSKGRSDQKPRRDNKKNASNGKPGKKFNTLDFSHIDLDKDSDEKADKNPAEAKSADAPKGE